MVRRRFIQQPDGALLEVPLDHVAESPASAAGHIITDTWLEGTVSPIDGTLIDTRAKMKAHMSQHGVAHTDEIAPDVERARWQRTNEMNISRVRDVVDAYRAVESGYKPVVEREK